MYSAAWMVAGGCWLWNKARFTQAQRPLSDSVVTTCHQRKVLILWLIVVFAGSYGNWWQKKNSTEFLFVISLVTCRLQPPITSNKSTSSIKTMGSCSSLLMTKANTVRVLVQHPLFNRLSTATISSNYSPNSWRIHVFPQWPELLVVDLHSILFGGF